MMKAVAIGGWAGPGIHQPGGPMTGRKNFSTIFSEFCRLP